MMRYGRILLTVVALITAFVFLFPSGAAAAGKTVGVIMTGNIPYYKDIHKAFSDGLAAEGLGPGSVEVVLQTPSPETMSWANAARKLVAVGVDVIVAYGAPATLTAMAETSDVPIVFAGVYDPQSLGVQGKNATGIGSTVPVASLVKNLKAISGFSKLGIVYSTSEKDTVLQANDVARLESTYGYRSSKFNVKKTEDIARISSVDALFLTTGCAAMTCVSGIVSTVRKEKIPTCTTIGGGEQSGIILTLSANPQEQGRTAAKITARVVRGEKPSSIPIEQAKKIDLIINLKEANDMGLKVPFDLLTSATKVIK
jgi:putative ABC transport system substrate-binding protein